MSAAVRRSVLGSGEKRWKITDVVGSEDGLGVECLSGSGAIASIYAKAFKEGFTITLVSGRTVGIGAYLARLGRRYVTLVALAIISVKAILVNCDRPAFIACVSLFLRCPKMPAYPMLNS